jgi:hypothetical protein
LGLIDASGETVLHKMHPSVIKGILPLLSEEQKAEVERVSEVRSQLSGLTWEEHITWSSDGVDRGVSSSSASDEEKEEKKRSFEIGSDGSSSSSSIERQEKKDEERVVVARGGDCDFDVVTKSELMRMDKYVGRTAFQENYLRWNKPVLVLGYAEGEDWEEMKETWGKESWITKMFGKETVGGCILFLLFLGFSLSLSLSLSLCVSDTFL